MACTVMTNASMDATPWTVVHGHFDASSFHAEHCMFTGEAAI